MNSSFCISLFSELQFCRSPGQSIPVSSLMRANPVSIAVAPENLNENKACIAAGKANR